MSQLPPFLVRNGGVNSGFMIAQVTAAALASENKALSHPHSVDSLPTSANQEDHVSMAPAAGRRLWEMASNTAGVLAVEWLAACQGVDLREGLKSSALLEQHAMFCASMLRITMTTVSLRRILIRRCSFLKKGGWWDCYRRCCNCLPGGTELTGPTGAKCRPGKAKPPPGFLSGVHRRYRRASKRMEVHVKAHHRAAGTFVHFNPIHIQCMNREDIAVGFPFWWCSAAVPRFTKVGTRLDRASGRAATPEPAPCGRTRVLAGRLATIQCHQPEPVGASGS